MSSVYFLSVQEVNHLHNLLIEQFGGTAGLRDSSLLESAVLQAQSAIFGEYLHKNVYEMAAAYCFHIIKNHPFVDGNKRTGLLSAVTFLGKNGLTINIEFDALYQLAIDVATSKMPKDEIALFFRSCTTVDNGNVRQPPVLG